ncbi:MAG: aminotransferase class V-fold PLP-dependent enzyme [Deltaproteobacteria bacterium]|nr:aminotransferase class V-fold PLP-dependent enzyme [Deltaproteobacteria bacterium]
MDPVTLTTPPPAAALALHWSLDAAVDFLNHGSYGACPTAVLEAQGRMRARMEREPVRFFLKDLEGLLDSARVALALFVGAEADDLAFVPNATSGVNTVLRSLRLAPGDELLTTDHAYNACANALRFVAEQAGARVVTVHLPFPLAGPGVVVDAVLDAVTERTTLALLDHVTSPTALRLPLETLVRELSSRGVDVLVDGAHAPGMLPLDVEGLGAAYYTGNLHKWVCAPKGAGFLYVRKDRQAGVRPLVISHGANAPRRDRSRFQLEFGWTGTDDPTAYLCAAEALRVLASLLPGGWDDVLRRNRATALAARDTLCQALGVPPPAPDGMLGSMATIPLPESAALAHLTPSGTHGMDALQGLLLERHRIQVPVIPWSGPSRKLLRVSAQLYNHPEQYERLAQVLRELYGFR